jgi:Zn-dependent peptidase ImmA (M78 family)
MWLDNASQELVDSFWRDYEYIEEFPRNLERPLAFVLPITLVNLPRLRLYDIEAWLQNRNVNFKFDCQSRAVRGCLIAFRGQAVIFLDGTDAENEKRFTLAHEIAHFMVDYWRPRQNAINKLGSGIADVIDGIRQPTMTERVHALLGSTRIGVHTDLMEREQRLDDVSGALWTIEDRADRIALTLLAPPRIVMREAEISNQAYSVREAALMDLLCKKFGLPASVAKSYSRTLLTIHGKGQSWLDLVGLH